MSDSRAEHPNFLDVCMYMNVCVPVCLRVCVCECVHVHAYAHVCTCTRVCACFCVCACVNTTGCCGEEAEGNTPVSVAVAEAQI